MSQSSLYVAMGLLAMVASWYVMPRRWMALLSFLARVLTGFKARDVTVNGVKWHYIEGGKGPTLVILHGIAAEADHWLGVAGPLRRQFRVLVPDLPGFGASQKPKGLDFHIEQQARRLGAWLDQLGIEECILAGNSMGAWVAANFAANHPQRVRALWLMDAFGVMSAQHSQVLDEFLEGGTNPFKVDSMREYAELVDIMFYERPHVPYPLARAGYLNTHRLKDELPRMNEEFLRESEPLCELAPRLTMPVLIEWGEEDKATHPDGARVLHERIPNSMLVTHPEVGHLAMIEAPTLAVQAFQAFAERYGLTGEPASDPEAPVNMSEVKKTGP